jgi:hypothetical protein
MTEIEDVVRQSLADQVRRQPPMTGSAARAIAGAAAARRRHTALAVGAAAVALVAVVAGVATLHKRGTAPVLPPATGRPSGSPAPSPSTVPSAPRIGLSALVGRDKLLLPDGRLLSVSGVGGAGARVAYQTRDGWLVEGFGGAGPDSESLWLFAADGTARQLVDHTSGAIVAPDGERLAWRTGTTLTVAHLDAGHNLVTDAKTQVDRGFPQLFAGTAVILGYTETGGGIDGWDVWVPQRGAYSPSWSTTQANGIGQVFTPTADGRWVIGLVAASPGSGDKASCLARMDPLDTLRVVATACGLPVARDWASLSPDGHWLAYTSADQGYLTQLVLVDATTMFQQQKLAGTWPDTLGGIWTGPDTMVARDADGRLHRYRVGRSEGEQVDLVGLPPGGQISLVPKLS